MTCDGTIWIRPCDSGCEGVAGADSFYLGSAQDDAFIMTSAAFLFAPIFFRVFHFSFKFLHFSIHSYIFFLSYCLSDCYMMYRGLFLIIFYT